MATELQSKAALQPLLTAFNYLAPNGQDQKAMAARVHDMQAEGESTEQICRAIASAIFDGIAYGNWPTAKMGGA